ncbi:hypothetical protein GCM10027596_01860 [Nocardioides korecus]
MSETNRRKFLAVTGAGAVAGAVGLAASPASAAVTRRADSAQEPVVAYIEDHSSDELHLMVGEREVVVHDHDLVARILNAAGGI